MSERWKERVVVCPICRKSNKTRFQYTVSPGTECWYCEPCNKVFNIRVGL